MLKKVAILANGGDVSGFNAVIRAIIKNAAPKTAVNLVINNSLPLSFLLANNSLPELLINPPSALELCNKTITISKIDIIIINVSI